MRIPRGGSDGAGDHAMPPDGVFVGGGTGGPSRNAGAVITRPLARIPASTGSASAPVTASTSTALGPSGAKCRLAPRRAATRAPGGSHDRAPSAGIRDVAADRCSDAAGASRLDQAAEPPRQDVRGDVKAFSGTARTGSSRGWHRAG